ncbi:hypothetical protein [Actinoplanes couchii]|nr:hypothetical protein [Actinoplanes couchii]MDR6318237.1 hypothetical protein [Actinoplanes couchii]
MKAAGHQIIDRFVPGETPPASDADRVAWAGALLDAGDPGPPSTC